MAGTGPNLRRKKRGKAGRVTEGKMRKLRVPLILLCVCSGLLLGASKIYASQSVALFSGGYQLQNLEILDDLDPRDATNQSIQTKKALDGLTEIFQSGLFNLLTAAEIYSTVEVLSTLSKSLNLAAQSLVRNLPSTVQNLMAVFLPSMKQLQNILVCLSGISSFVFFAFCLSLTAYNLTLPSLHSSPVVLRC